MVNALDGLLGEVIATSTQLLEAECHGLDCGPEFASFVRVTCAAGDQLAVVTHVATGPIDGNRVVQAHRMTPEELADRMPHLSTLLRTTFQARIVGYTRQGARHAGTPPTPAPLHSFVYRAAPEEIREVTREPWFLRSLLADREAPLEDLLARAVQHAAAAWGPEGHFRSVQWGKYLARLLRGEYLTLEGVLQRLADAGSRPSTSVRPQPAAIPRYEEPLPIAGVRRERDPFDD